MSDRDYCYPPDCIVLRNRLDIRDAPALKAIHLYLFQGVYAWAGEVRTVEIAKDGSRFQPRRFIETGMADIHRRIVAAGYFAGLEPDEFAGSAGLVLGNVNHVHPFLQASSGNTSRAMKHADPRNCRHSGPKHHASPRR